MTNKKTTRRAFVSSIISLMLCIAMLVGTTFAWFTDAAESGMNEIIAGNLDVELYDAKDNKIDSATKVFFDVEGKEIQYWEPGVVAYANLKVANVGTMDLKYALSVNYKDRNNLNGHVLSEVLKVAFVDGHIEGKTREEVLELATAENNGMSLPGFSMSGKLAAADTTATVGTETVEDEDAFSVIVYWEPNSAEIDNQYNVNNGQKTNDGNPLGIGLGVKVVASQLSGSGENDSFDDYYDEDAVYPENRWLGDVAHDLTYNAVSKQIEIATGADFALVAQIVNSAELPEGFDPLDKIPAEVEEAMVNGFEGLEVVLTDSIDLNNIFWTPIGINGASFKGTFDGNGKTIYNLAIQQLPSVMTLSVDSEANKLYSGLFGRVAGATIKNLNVVNAQITNVGNGTGVIAGTAGVNAGKNTTIENVSVTNAVINSNRQTGGIVGSIYGSVLNCTVTNALITATPDALTDDPATFDVEYDNGDKVGGIVGFSQSDNYSGKFEGNKVSDTTLKAYRDVAGIVGAANDNSVSGSSVTNVTIIADQETGYYGVKTVNAGAVVGRDLDGNAEDAGANNTSENTTITVKAGFASAEELQAVIDKGADEIILTQDVALDADTTITIKAGTTTILNLNGKTLAGTSDQTGANRNLISVRGILTVKNGTITTLHTGTNMGWNNSTNVFDVTAGGVLNIEDATVENLGGSDMGFCVHMNNWGEVTLNAKNTAFRSKYVGIRVFNSGNDMNNVALTNCNILTDNSCFWVHNYTAADFGNDEVKATAAAERLNVTFKNTAFARTNGSKSLIRYGFTDSIYYSDAEMTEVVAGTVKALNYAFENGRDVLMNNDIKDAAPTTIAPYGNLTLVVHKGGIFDGNGKTLSMKDVDNGKENKFDNYVVMTSGGIIKNLAIDDGFRGIMIMNPTEDVILDNVNVGGDVCYAINTGSGDGTKKLIVSDSSISGWTSLGTGIESVSFTNCDFGQGSYYTDESGRLLKPYVNATITDCTFIQGYYLDLSALVKNNKVVIDNCIVGGREWTADVCTASKDWNDYKADYTVFVELPSWANSLSDCITFQ